MYVCASAAVSAVANFFEQTQGRRLAIGSLATGYYSSYWLLHSLRPTGSLATGYYTHLVLRAWWCRRFVYILQNNPDGSNFF